MRVAAFLCVALVASLVHAVDLTVELDYSTYRGSASSNGVNEWLGIRFAAPPTGHLRFAAPQDPLKTVEIQEADKRPMECWTPGAKPRRKFRSEDCLFLSVWSPANASADKPLPVYFSIASGGYAKGSAAKINGSHLVAHSESNIVVVASSYRTGMFGFLTGKEVAAEGNLNAGLKDQTKALEWIKKHIIKFGGNPDHVVIGGHSAGGGSVAAHLAMQLTRNDTLFHGAISTSTWTPPMQTADESQFMYDSFVEQAGCKGAADTLGCLRALDIRRIQKVNKMIPNINKEVKGFTYFGPAIENDTLVDYVPRLFHQGKVARVPTVFGGMAGDGASFTSDEIHNVEESKAFLHKSSTISKPGDANRAMDVYNITDDPDSSPRLRGPSWIRTSDVFGDFWMWCPAMLASESMAAYRYPPTYQFSWAAADPMWARTDGVGAPHFAQEIVLFDATRGRGGLPESYKRGGKNWSAVDAYRHYYISFIRTLDPNTLRLNGTPEWAPWRRGPKDVFGWNRMVFETGGQGKMERISMDQWRRCRLYDEIRVVT